MRYFILSFLLFFIISFSRAQESDPAVCKDLSKIISAEIRINQQKLNQRTNNNTRTYDIKYHRMEWNIDPGIRYIRGKITTYFVPVEGDFEKIFFDLRDNMQINNVMYHGSSLTYQQINDNLQIQLPQTIAVGILDSISVSYEGTPASQGFGSFETGSHNGFPVLWTLSEPYGAKTWWPCKQDLNDKIDSVDILIRTPAGNRAATAGILINEIHNSSESIYHWKHRYPIPAYLIGIAVTNYLTFSDFLVLPGGDSIEILNYVYPESLSAARIQLEKTKEIMQLYNDLFGTYPFASEKYGHAQFGWGGGMEHQTMSFMGGFSYGLVAHELAHQWFGDMITCGSWQDIWLNEGFATYLSGLVYEFLGTDQEWINWKLGRINQVVSQPGGSVWVKDTTVVNRIFDGRLSYNKGAYLLHMLRWKLGDQAFFSGIRNYLQDPSLAYGYARTGDLKWHLEQAANLDLSEFFSDWFYGEGFPSYFVEWNQENELLHLKIRQTTSDPASVEFFEMPVPIYISGAGQDSLLRLDYEIDGQEFTAEIPFEIESISFDPELWLLSKDNRVERITTGLREESPLKVIIAPNPVENQIRIALEDPIRLMDRVEVFDAKGLLIFHQPKAAKIINLNTTDWPGGIYSVRVWSKGRFTVGEIVRN